MANGLFSRNAQVMGPEQAAANAGRTLSRALGEPVLGMMGMQSEEQAVMNVMKGVDPTNLTSVTQGFRDILEISPEAAAEYRKQMLPFVQSMQEQMSQESSMIKAKADLIGAVKKTDPNSADEEKIYDNLMSEYNKNFCAGGGLIGGECKPPQFDETMRKKLINSGFVNDKGEPVLPDREQFVQKFYGDKALGIYKRRTGQEVSVEMPEDKVEVQEKVKQPKRTTTENVVDKGGDIIEISPEAIKARYELKPNEEEIVKYISKMLSDGMPEREIIKRISAYRSAKNLEMYGDTTADMEPR